MKKFLFVCGGTGGHIFPAVAIAESLKKMGVEDIVFAGRKDSMEERLVSKNWPYEFITAVPLHRGPFLKNLTLPFNRGRLSTVFGCGGDRDRTKRPIMGSIAERMADRAWLTSDNPRTENPSAIIADVRAGMVTDKFVVVEDRAEAIAKACASLEPGDWLVIAGKGHEDYQIVGKTKHHFDDREEAVKAMEKC